MTPLPASLEVYPDYGMIGIYGSQFEVLDFPASADPAAVVVATEYAAYLRTGQTLDPVTLHFGTADAPAGLDALGTVTIELPVDDVLVSQITGGAHGPYTLPEGPGIYRMTVTGDGSVRPVRALWVELNRIGDPVPEDEDDE
ncbi:hypothetical protein [Amycolatopsis circi]|uniref:hypothetical protein n=1 Tax=Amycolatopsis circi TaxID=871959 RepID=UPI0013BE9155|nr:hypothetical protein [Amycolatopsis circi]